MPSKTEFISHEAEVQRQHVRLHLPISMQIRNITVEVNDWSNSGAAFNATPLKAANIALKMGDVFETKLFFDFKTFALSVPLSCEVRHINSDGSRVGCRFNDMNERNISIMQYLVSAYISGDLVQVGDMLEVVARKNFTHSRKPPKDTEKRGKRNKIMSGALAATAAFLMFYIGTSVYDSVYIVEANTAKVSPANIDGDASATVVEAIISHENAIKLAKGMSATLGFPGYNRYFEGKIHEIFVEDVENGDARIYIIPDNILPVELVRSPVEVKVDIF